MPKDSTRSLMTAGAFAGVVALDTWLAIYISALPVRLVLIFGCAYVAVRMWARYAGHSAQPREASTQGGGAPEHGTSADVQMLAEITTALEHLRSVRLLLEVSETHRQPLPRAVPVNVHLVIKHLDKARRRFSAPESLDLPAIESRACIDGARPLTTLE